MITLNFKLEELVNIILRNTVLPDKINSIETSNNKIKVTLNINKVFSNIVIYIKYQSYNNGKLFFSIDVGIVGNLIIPIISKFGLFKSENINLDNNFLQVDLNNIIKEKNLNLQIYSIEKNGEDFILFITNLSDT